MEEFKTKIKQMELVIPPGQIEAFLALPQNTKDPLNIHRTKTKSQNGDSQKRQSNPGTNQRPSSKI